MTTHSPAPLVVADAPTRAEILAVEERRCRALVDVDLATLEDLYDESLVHTHAPGLTHDRSQLLHHVATRQAYLGIARGELTIRVIGDVAIMTGRIRNRLDSPDGTERVLGGQVIQVLRRCDDGAWRFVSFQMTPDGTQAFTMTDSERASAERAERAATTIDVSTTKEVQP
ncbi:MAG TPA: nuclear transport factor 2 family protein [Nocardioides sp.]|uniref:nuclear transport factor 2 family protein n=1 Tax=Nocardioides sp. TaxID=35761 RepID=UPI002CA4DE4B|nr:nuclear transport factor 2 family protein [Nocardioides sp.]HTW15619.1 nuclear transport factor 2 family protein [Nocardioides sp.]